MTDAPTSASRGAFLRRLSALGPVLGLVFVFGLFAILKPSLFLTASNLQLMLLQTSVVATAALGMTLIIISGGIDLSVGSTIALVTVVIGTAMKQFAGDADPAGAGVALLAAGVGVAAGAMVGACIGALVTWGRMMPFIVTLGMWGAVRGAAKGLAHEQMVAAPGSWLTSLMVQPRGAMRGALLAPGVWLTLFLAGLVALALHYTRAGRHLFAVGSNEQTARLCGVSVERVKLMTYVLGGVFAGFAGVLQFSYLTVGDPTTAAGYELNIIAAVVIGGASLSGGRGSILGSLMGAMIMTVVANGCTKLGLSNWVQEIVTGAIIVLAVGLDRLRSRAA
ncbi:MAG: ABC transporter permease [Planctomycetota bacterium]|nr:ABC transporter permease [Planctomycetota bacterium]